MKIVSSLALAALVLAAGSATAQPTGSSSSTTTHKTPVGPVTHTQTTVPFGNGTHTTNTVSPGNGTKPAPYIGTTTSNPYPNNQKSTTAPTIGVTIPQ